MPSAAESITYNYEPHEVEQPKLQSPVIQFDAACQYLQISRETLYRLVKSSQIGHIRITGVKEGKSGKIIFYKKHLDDYLSAHEVRVVRKEVPSNKKSKN